MTIDFRVIAIAAFYILATVLAFILSVKIRRGYKNLSQFLQEDWPEKWAELSDDALTMKSLYQTIFNFIWRGKIFKSARIALAVKQLKQDYTIFFVVFFVLLFVSCWLFYLSIPQV